MTRKKIKPDFYFAKDFLYRLYRHLLTKCILIGKKIEVRGLGHVLNNNPCIIVSSHYKPIYDIATVILKIPRTPFFFSTDKLYTVKKFVELYKFGMKRKVQYGRRTENGARRIYLFAKFTWLYPVALFVASQMSMFEQIPVKIRYDNEIIVDGFSNRKAIELSKDYLKAGRTLVVFPKNHQDIPSRYSKFLRKFMPGAALTLYELEQKNIKVPAIPVGFSYNKKQIVMNIGKPMYADCVTPGIFVRTILGEKLPDKPDAIASHVRNLLKEFAGNSELNDFISFIRKAAGTSNYQVVLSKYLEQKIPYIKQNFPKLHKRIIVESFRDLMERQVAKLVKGAGKIAVP